jgi:hypothetical protein
MPTCTCCRSATGSARSSAGDNSTRSSHHEHAASAPDFALLVYPAVTPPRDAGGIGGFLKLRAVQPACSRALDRLIEDVRMLTQPRV